MDSLPTIAMELKKLREARGMSVRKLSKESGVSAGYISQIENGSRQTPSPDLIKKLAKGLRVGEYFLLRKAGFLEAEEDEVEEKKEEVDKEELNFEISSPLADFILMEMNTNKKKTFLKRRYEETGNKFLNVNNPESMVNIFGEDSIETKRFEILVGSNLLSSAKGYTHLDEKMHFFLSYFAGIGDFLELLRLSKNKSIEEMAELLKIENTQYEELEKSHKMSSFESWSEKIGEVLEVGNFIEWYEVMVKTDPLAYSRHQSKNKTHQTISITVQSKFKKLDANGEEYTVRYSEEELKENLFNLSCLLNQKEHKVLYKNKVLTDSEIEKVKTMLEVLLED